MLRKIVILLFVSASIFSADKFNSFMWNRKNYEAGNGKIDTRPWFEWWYYKVVVPETDESFYIVYGVVNPWDTDRASDATRAYVGIGNFKQEYIIENTFPVKQFRSSYDKTYVQIGINKATDNHLNGCIKDKGGKPICWDIKIDHIWSFNAMGWAMGKYDICNIYWYPAQADALFTGFIQYGKKVHVLKYAPGYQDRNWGVSFPDWWTWIVSNNFDDHPDTTLVIGGGRPKINNTLEIIEGVSIGLKHKDKIYEFRPNDLDSMKMEINFGTWEVDANDGEYRLKVSAHAPSEQFMDLEFMSPSGKIYHDYETLAGALDVKLYKRTNYLKWKLIDKLHSDYAGIEYGSFNLQGLDRVFNNKVTLFESK